MLLQRPACYPIRPGNSSKALNPVPLDGGVFMVAGISGHPRAPFLPYTVDEATGIRQLCEDHSISFEQAINSHAKPSEVMATIDGSSFSILHFACHGLGHEIYEANALVLEDDYNSSGGRLLTTRMIEKLDLRNIQTVILSACNSSYTHGKRGTTVQGLCWAFLNAGVKSVFATRFVISDYYGAQIGKSIYEPLIDKMPPIEVLNYVRETRSSSIPPKHMASWALFI